MSLSLKMSLTRDTGTKTCFCLSVPRDKRWDMNYIYINIYIILSLSLNGSEVGEQEQGALAPPPVTLSPYRTTDL